VQDQYTLIKYSQQIDVCISLHHHSEQNLHEIKASKNHGKSASIKAPNPQVSAQKFPATQSNQNSNCICNERFLTQVNYFQKLHP